LMAATLAPNDEPHTARSGTAQRHSGPGVGQPLTSKLIAG
jgi:hypothetical protein